MERPFRKPLRYSAVADHHGRDSMTSSPYLLSLMAPCRSCWAIHIALEKRLREYTYPLAIHAIPRISVRSLSQEARWQDSRYGKCSVTGQNALEEVLGAQMLGSVLGAHLAGLAVCVHAFDALPRLIEVGHATGGW